MTSGCYVASVPVRSFKITKIAPEGPSEVLELCFPKPIMDPVLCCQVKQTISISGRVFCSLHRLPELHGCDFDHKEDGRREAREKMVKPVRHLGTSFRRLDNSS